MKKFPLTVVDKFFETPDLIRDFALSQEYYKSDDGRWPGLRSDPLNEISPELFNTFCHKILKIFFNFDYTSTNWNLEASFQKVPCQRPDNIKNINDGWIHSDDDCFFSGVVYLNKNFPPNTGTSIYSPIDEESLNFSVEEKCKFYLGKEITDEEYLTALTKNNNQFLETVKIENVFNRLIIFESGQYHGVPSFFSGTDEDRLTLVFFMKNLSIRNDTFPLYRSKVLM